MDWHGALIYGAPGESRTLDLFVRNEMLYPSELRAHFRHYRKFLRGLRGIWQVVWLDLRRESNDYSGQTAIGLRTLRLRWTS